MGKVNAAGGYPTAYVLYAEGELNPLGAIFQAKRKKLPFG